MAGRLLLGLLGGLGKGMAAAGGAGMALRLAGTALGGLAGGGRGRGGGGSVRRGGKGEELSLEDVLQSLTGTRERRAISSPKGYAVSEAAPGVGETRAAGPEDADDAILRCLAAHATSFIDGRVRLRHPALQGRDDLEEARRRVLARPGVRELTFNAATGSALLLYDAARLNRLEALTALLPLGAYLAGASPEESAAS